MSFSSSSSSSSGGGRSRSVQTQIINGRQTTVIREVDEYGNETVQTQTSDGFGAGTNTAGRQVQYQ